MSDENDEVVRKKEEVVGHPNEVAELEKEEELKSNPIVEEFDAFINRLSQIASDVWSYGIMLQDRSEEEIDDDEDLQEQMNNVVLAFRHLQDAESRLRRAAEATVAVTD